MSVEVNLSGRTALVTGASRGIGLCIAKTFSRVGARVVLVARNREVLEQAAEDISGVGGEVLIAVGNTGRDEDVARIQEEVAQVWGHVDTLVNNAATNPYFGNVVDADSKVFQATLNTNLIGYFRTIQAFVPGMIESGGGRIVNISSVAGFKPPLGLGLYAISKAAVSMLTACLARELGPRISS